MSSTRMGELKKKILLLLAAGVALSASKSMSKQFSILQATSNEWKAIRRESLKVSLVSLYNARLIDFRPRGDSFEIILSHDGKKIVQRLNLENIVIKKQKVWDGDWRIVLFDIPEPQKKVRDAIRFHLKDMGLIEYQKSVFITPYPCEKELKFVAEFFRARRFIRLIVAKAIDNESEFKRKFGIR